MLVTVERHHRGVLEHATDFIRVVPSCELWRQKPACCLLLVLSMGDFMLTAVFGLGKIESIRDNWQKCEEGHCHCAAAITAWPNVLDSR